MRAQSRSVQASGSAFDAGSTPPRASSYGKIIQREIRKVEVQLKLAATDEERLVESFKILWPDGTANDLARVLDLKVRTPLPLALSVGRHFGLYFPSPRA